ncbi:hypothetical protein Tco_1107241 [Tanacetum coccineum]
MVGWTTLAGRHVWMDNVGWTARLDGRHRMDDTSGWTTPDGWPRMNDTYGWAMLDGQHVFSGYGVLNLVPLWSLVKCRHRYAVSLLMDTAYWMSE